MIVTERKTSRRLGAPRASLAADLVTTGVRTATPPSDRSRGRHRRSRLAATPTDGPNRIVSLDGLRGIAALVVFVHHGMLTWPAHAEPYREPAAGAGPGIDTAEGLTWWATYTPLHLAWAGTEAVFVFFVLSGLVLALPVAGHGRLKLAGYYPRRLLRLYLPVWAAVGLAVAWALAVPRQWAAGDSWWLAGHVTDPSTADVWDDVLLLFGAGSANHVLWSLQWEVLYSLALPLVLVLGRAWPRLLPIKVVLVLGALVLGAATDSPALWYLPMFVLGTLMACERSRLAGWARALDERDHATRWWSALLVAGLLLLVAYWLVRWPDPALVAGARGLQAIGACTLVFVVWHWSGARRPLSRPVAQWLGSRSFSLYLVHLPVVASVPLVLGGQPTPWVVLSVAAAVTFPLTEVFHRLVERPSHRIAQRAGRRLSAAPAVSEVSVSEVPVAEVSVSEVSVSEVPVSKVPVVASTTPPRDVGVPDAVAVPSPRRPVST
ncbi:MAG: acyltransferase family protein [Pseudonocardia sp.]